MATILPPEFTYQVSSMLVIKFGLSNAHVLACALIHLVILEHTGGLWYPEDSSESEQSSLSFDSLISEEQSCGAPTFSRLISRARYGGFGSPQDPFILEKLKTIANLSHAMFYNELIKACFQAVPGRFGYKHWRRASMSTGEGCPMSLSSTTKYMFCEEKMR